MKKALVVIDMQNDFITGPLGSPQARAIVPKVAEKLKVYEDVIFTRDTHDEQYLETSEGKRLPVPHCLKDSEGWQIAGELDVDYSDLNIRIFDKGTFGSLELAEFLCARRFDEVELVGLVSSVCVVSNALILRTYLPETKITVDAACTAGVTDEDYRASLCVMKMCHIDIINEELSNE
jgi:nicotinamidase-related amidase